MKRKRNKETAMDSREAEKLAEAMLGLDEDSVDIAAIEQALEKRYGVSFDGFMKVAEALMQFTIPAMAEKSREYFHCFVKDGRFICKLPVRGPIERIAI
jgi:uncharacterized membrane protein